MSNRKSELKRAYKESHRPVGVYQVRNTVNGKVFVGSSSNLPGILNRHRFNLRMGDHRNRQLQDDWNVNGEESFVFEVLEELELRDDPGYDSRSDLAVLEELWIEKLEPFGEQGYNRPPL